jgi:lysyl-tRNA synthetase class 1
VHWVDDIAVNHLLTKRRSHVIASGTSISGEIHVGNAGDIIMGDGIARAVRERGGEAKIVWIMDDVDGLRSIPKGLPESFAEHLGKPVYNVPDPWGCHERYTKHFAERFLVSLREADIQPEIVSGYEMYRDGRYEPETKVAQEQGELIRRIIREVSGSKKEEAWLPFEALCEKCGKISSTRAERVEGDRVFYRCIGGVAGHKEMKGCGHEGLGSLRHGKLPWVVEWAARWKILGVTCEPFGKEHGAAGGSYDRSSRIVQEVFGYPAPHPVMYEFILEGGKKISSSKGNVFTIRQMEELAPVDVVRFFFFRTYPDKHKEFKFPVDMVQLISEFERFEHVHFGLRQDAPEDELGDMKRAYALSRVGPPLEACPTISMKHLMMVSNVAKDWVDARKVLDRQGLDVRPEAETGRRFELGKRLMAAYFAWLEQNKERLQPRELARYLGAVDRFEVAPTRPGVEITPAQSSYLRQLAHRLELADWRAEQIHIIVHETAKESGLGPKDAFMAVYLAILGQANGPRAGFLLSALDRTFVTLRLKEMAA